MINKLHSKYFSVLLAFLIGWTFTDVICIWPVNFYPPALLSSTPAYYSFFSLHFIRTFSKARSQGFVQSLCTCFLVMHILVFFQNYYIFHLFYQSDLRSPPRLCHFFLSLPSFSPSLMSPASDNPSAD